MKLTGLDGLPVRYIDKMNCEGCGEDAAREPTVCYDPNRKVCGRCVPNLVEIWLADARFDQSGERDGGAS
jgi:hypothetical protein